MEGKDVEKINRLLLLGGGLLIICTAFSIYSCITYADYSEADRARAIKLESQIASLRTAYNELDITSKSIGDTLLRAKNDNARIRESLTEANRRIEQLKLTNSQLGKRVAELTTLFGKLTEGDRQAEAIVAGLRREAEEALRIIRELSEDG